MRLTELTHEYQFDPEVLRATKDMYAKEPKGEVTLYYKGEYEQRKAEFSEGQIDDLGITLNNIGWKKLDNGLYSTVYANPNKPYILKVNNRPDRAFAWFALLTHKFPNIHFPKIGNAKFTKIGNFNYYIYLIEKLKLILPDQTAVTISDFCNAAASQWYSPIQDVIAQFSFEEFPVDKELAAALRILGKYKKKCRLDIHENNVMQRADGTLVIIDPYTIL